MRRLVLITAAALALTACAQEPISNEGTDNPNVPAAHLLTIEGCKVYRFKDVGEYHYLTTCPASSVSSVRTESCGKNCTREVPHAIQTVEVGQ